MKEELQAYLEQRIEELRAGGATPEHARQIAVSSFGSMTAVQEQCRDARRLNLVDELAQDLRYGARMLRRNPLFALTAALSIGIGIGANTTIFTVANRLLLREPVGVADPDRLVDIGPTRAGARLVEPMLSYPAYLDIRQRTTMLDGVYGYQFEPQAMSMAAADGADRVFGTFVTGNYFDVLGVRPAAGRLFGAIDSEEPGVSPVVVLSHSFWKQRFNMDPTIIGRTLQLNGHPFTVAGVTSEGFRGTFIVVPDIWLPASMVGVTPDGAYRLAHRRSTWLILGARLKPGVTIARAAAEMDAIGRALERDGMTEGQEQSLRLTAWSPIPRVLVTPVMAFVSLLMGLVSVVLAIACANVAGVLLARASSRRREIAVRLAIGARRGRLVRQLLTETLLLFALGGGVGLLLARVMTSLLVRVVPATPVPVDLALPLDLRVVLFTMGLSLVASVLSGLVPALQSSKPDVASALKDEAQSTPQRMRLRNAFVVGQIAFSILLMVGAGLLVRALHRSASVDLGFDPFGVEVVALDLSLAGYKPETGLPFLAGLHERLGSIPGVKGATIATEAPSAGGGRRIARHVRGLGASDPVPSFQPNTSVITPGYFATMRIPLLSGRDFNAADRRGAQRVAIVNEATVRELWPGEDAIGRMLPWQPADAQTRPSAAAAPVVIGVVADLKSGRPGESAVPTVFVPLLQQYESRVSILARTEGAASAVGEIRAALRALDPKLPIISARKLTDEASPALLQLRVSAAVAGAVGVVGLFLASIGIYGLAAYNVAMRTREIGIRVAMGASPAAVARMILRDGMGLVVIGSAIGLLLAAASSRILVKMLFGVPPLDPLVFGGTAILFAGVGFAACYVPARRATGVDAIVALRCE